MILYLHPNYGSAVSDADLSFVQTHIPYIQVLIKTRLPHLLTSFFVCGQFGLQIQATLKSLAAPLPELARVFNAKSPTDLVRAYLISRDVAVFHPIQGSSTKFDWKASEKRLLATRYSKYYRTDLEHKSCRAECRT